MDWLLTSKAINENQVTDSLIQSSAEMYINIMNCPNMDKLGPALQRPYEELFSKNDIAESFPYKQGFSWHE